MLHQCNPRGIRGMAQSQLARGSRRGRSLYSTLRRRPERSDLLMGTSSEMRVQLSPVAGALLGAPRYTEMRLAAGAEQIF